jgi:hypothetical protein
MNQEKKRCVVSLSKRSGFKDMPTTVKWLIDKGEEPYYFHFKPKEGLAKNSIVLFSFEAQIFGRARVKRGVEELSLKEQQKHDNKEYNFRYTMVLYQVDKKKDIVQKPYPRKKDLIQIIYPKKQFGNLFTYLTPKMYQQILGKARLME